jgi:hypothetical protein
MARFARGYPPTTLAAEDRQRLKNRRAAAKVIPSGNLKRFGLLWQETTD